MSSFQPAVSKAIYSAINFFIHLNTVWLFALLEELVLHHVKKEEMQKFIAEYIAFETAGWKELMNV